MVRALLDGSKTQTRRIVKPRPIEKEGMNCQRLQFLNRKDDLVMDTWVGDEMARIMCPHGQPGDRLWVRETHAKIWPGEYAPDDEQGITIEYRADTNGQCLPGDWPDGSQGDDVPKWIPSIHMRRKYSRINLEIVSVRVERLQDISEADALAEGIPEEGEVCSRCGSAGAYMEGGDVVMCEAPRCGDGAVDDYRHLWESINGAGSWAEKSVGVGRRI
ncbi:hypothetical protein ACFS07_13115 [Undibacterium arcticum]